MSENSTEMPVKTRKNFLKSLAAKARQAKNRVVRATKNLGTKIKNAFQALLRGSKKATIAVVKAAASALRYVGVGILTVAQYIVLVVNLVLLWISLAILIVLHAIYKVILGMCIVLWTPNTLATSGKQAAKDDWSLYFAGWKPRNYFTLTLGEVAEDEGARSARVFMDAEEDPTAPTAEDTNAAQQSKGRATPRRRPHPRRVRPTVVPA